MEDGFVEVGMGVVERMPEGSRMAGEEPEKLIQAVGLAVCELVYSSLQEVSHIQARLFPNGIHSTPFSQLKAALVGRLVQVRGCVVRVGSQRPRIIQCTFRCAKCMGSFTSRMQDGVYRVPGRCTVAGCGGGSKGLTADRTDGGTNCVNWQQIRLQESLDDDDEQHDNTDNSSTARVPRSIDVEVEGGLVDCVAPGDSIALSALVKAADLSEGKAHVGSTYMVYLHANWIRPLKDHHDEDNSDTSTDELFAVIAGRKDMLPLLIASFCPQIYGHILPKFGLLLTLFGGTRRKGTSGSSTQIRADPHLLLVGDPGLGKSQLVRAAAAVAPRGIYVGGQTSTATGLTASLHHEGGSSLSSLGLGGAGYTLEAGAMVLADGGVCCVDEFDKSPPAQHSALLQVLEQQCVSIAKAGCTASLPARTSLIAAANPSGGHYSASKGGLMANLRIGAAMMSRFDLVFVMVDRADGRVDRLMSEQVLGGFGGSSNKAGMVRAFDQMDDQEDHSTTPLLARLQALDQLKPNTLLSPSQLRRLIAHCRSSVHPTLSPSAAALLRAFYLSLRAQERLAGISGTADSSSSSDYDQLPVTTRHLEAMVRLGEARARMEMRSVVEESDAQDIIDLIRHCRSSHQPIQANGAPQFGGASKRAKGTSRPTLIKRFVSELLQIASTTAQHTFTEQQLRDLHTSLGMAGQLPFGEMMDALGQYGYVLKRGPGLYKLIVT